MSWDWCPDLDAREVAGQGGGVVKVELEDTAAGPLTPSCEPCEEGDLRFSRADAALVDSKDRSEALEASWDVGPA